MSSRPELRNNAEKHFVEALRLSPQDPELHYWLGLYYKSFGLESRAFNEFRTTLRINPQHAGAKKTNGRGRETWDRWRNAQEALWLTIGNNSPSLPFQRHPTRQSPSRPQ